MSDLPIVTDPYAVDAAWLTAALNGAGIPVRVEGFTTQKVGDGMLGESVRFNLDYARPVEGAPASLVGGHFGGSVATKLPPKKMRAAVIVFGVVVAIVYLVK